MRTQYLPQAAADSLRAIALDPTYTRGIARAAKAFLCMGKTEESIQKYTAALELDPGNRSIRLVHARCFLVEVMLADAAHALDMLTWMPREELSKAKEVQAHLAAGRAALAVKDFAAALRHAGVAMLPVQAACGLYCGHGTLV